MPFSMPFFPEEGLEGFPKILIEARVRRGIFGFLPGFRFDTPHEMGSKK